MKFTKAQLYALIKECYAEWKAEKLLEFGSGTVNNLGGVAGNLGALRGTSEPPLENQADSLVQDKAWSMLVQLGLDKKVAQVIVDNVAISDLSIVIDKIPKIDTAQEEVNEEET